MSVDAHVNMINAVLGRLLVIGYRLQITLRGQGIQKQTVNLMLDLLGYGRGTNNVIF